MLPLSPCCTLVLLLHGIPNMLGCVFAKNGFQDWAINSLEEIILCFDPLTSALQALSFAHLTAQHLLLVLLLQKQQPSNILWTSRSSPWACSNGHSDHQSVEWLAAQKFHKPLWNSNQALIPLIKKKLLKDVFYTITVGSRGYRESRG